MVDTVCYHHLLYGYKMILQLYLYTLDVLHQLDKSYSPSKHSLLHLATPSSLGPGTPVSPFGPGGPTIPLRPGIPPQPSQPSLFF